MCLLRICTYKVLAYMCSTFCEMLVLPVKLRYYRLKIHTMIFTDSKRMLSFWAFLSMVLFGYGQETDSTHQDSIVSTHYFSGEFEVNTNAIPPALAFSTKIPGLYGKLSMGRKRLTFDPSVRFLLNGTPWFVFLTAHYKAVDRKRYFTTFGMHPFLYFETGDFSVAGVDSSMIQSFRNISVDHEQAFKISDRVGVGTYYFYSLGLEGPTRHFHFAMLNAYVRDIRLFKEVCLQVAPKLYWLSLDRSTGWYLNASVALYRNGFPLSIRGMVNQRIRSSIVGSVSYNWNLSLVYGFNKAFVALPVGI